MARATNIAISQAIAQSIRDPSLRFKLIEALAGAGSGISVGSSSGAAGAGGGTPVSSGSDAATRLAIALGDLDTAQDGDVITADSYNAIVDVLRALAGFGVGGGPVVSALPTAGVETFAPVLLGFFGTNIARAPPPPWELGYDGATADVESFGWLQATLPHGALISEVRVFNERLDRATVEVALRRFPLGDPTDPGVVLCTVRRASATRRETQPDSEPVRVSGISTGAALDELRSVDNERFRYQFEARSFGARVRIFALQVSWER